jgi:N-methylhydantoinase B
MKYTEAYTTYGVKVIVSPEVPNNEGAFRPLRITAPEGSILNARHPAPVAARHVVGHFLPHVVPGALKQALPERVMAEGSANIWGIQVAGKASTASRSPASSSPRAAPAPVPPRTASRRRRFPQECWGRSPT